MVSKNNVTHIALLSPAVGTPNVGDHFIEAAIRRLLREDMVYHRFSIRVPLKKQEIDAINKTSCALLCGTNLYQHDWHSALTPEILELIRVPVIPFGVGSSARHLTNLEVSETTRQMIRILHSRCKLGSVRDPHSAEVVSHAGVENAILTGCPVLFWMRGKSLPTIKSIKRQRIVVTARNWLMHSWPKNVDNPVQIRFFQKLLKSYPANQLLFVIHEEWDERLVDLLNIPRKIVFKSDKPEDYMKLYNDHENVILAMRLHAGMLAIANGIPAVFVGHDTRTYSFCMMLGLDYIELFSKTSAEDCITSIQGVLDGNVTPFARMQSQYQEILKAMERFLDTNDLPTIKFEGREAEMADCFLEV